MVDTGLICVARDRSGFEWRGFSHLEGWQRMIDCYDFIECGYLGTYVARKASAADDGLWIWAVFDINEENFLRLLTCPHSFFVELAIKWVETNGRATI